MTEKMKPFVNTVHQEVDWKTWEPTVEQINMLLKLNEAEAKTIYQADRPLYKRLCWEIVNLAQLGVTISLDMLRFYSYENKYAKGL